MRRGKKVSQSYCRVSFFFGIIRQLVPFIYHTLGSADSIAYKRHTCIYALSLYPARTHMRIFSNDGHACGGASMGVHTRARAHTRSCTHLISSRISISFHRIKRNSCTGTRSEEEAAGFWRLDTYSWMLRTDIV